MPDTALYPNAPHLPLFDIDKELKKAMHYYQAGELYAAEAVCRKILEIHPNHSESLHLSGIIAMMSYKCYKGHFEYDEKADIFHGQIIGIRDVVTFQGRSIDELRQALKDSLDDYLEMCEQEGKSPDKPFSGKFSLHLSPELHSRVAQSAALTKKSINFWMTEAIENFFKQENLTKIRQDV